MPNINAVANFDLGFVPVDNNFILNHMPKANGIYVKVYLYTLYTCLQSNTTVSTADIGSSLDLLESDVIQSLNYWTEQHLMNLNRDEDGLHIEFLNPSEPQKSESKPTEQALDVGLKVEKRPDYSPEEIHTHTHSPQIKTMFLVAQQYLGKTLTPNDMSMLYSFHDWLGLPTDVIELLIEYCADNNKRNMRYIEKVAINWAEQGINTPQKAEDQIHLFNKKYRRIMKAFGLSTMEPTPSQIEYMKKWFDDYQFTIEIIIEACNRTIKNISKPSFQYADSILSSWSKNKVRTFDDILALDNTYAKQKTSKPEVSNTNRPKGNQSYSKGQYGKTKFINFKQRSDIDYDEIERLERQHLENELLEGRS